MRYQRIEDWIAECRQTVRNDYDNLILFTGPEGVGKSTIQFQVLRALDPNFNVDNLAFTVEDFISMAMDAPKFSAVGADEALLNHRKAMHGPTIQLLDFLQICRGLNLHLGICFPHEAMLDGAVKNFRVRWNIHVPARGKMLLRYRTNRTVRTRTETILVHDWAVMGAWNTKPNSGPEWEAYKERKEEHMRGMVDVMTTEKPKAKAKKTKPEPTSKPKPNGSNPRRYNYL